MHYKTIILELLKQRPEIHDQLRTNRMLLPMLNLYASQMKASHESWKDRLSHAKPESDHSQIASEALEIALKELEDFLDSQTHVEDSEPLSLEGAMAFIRGHRPPE